jgi:hypothetical protein
MKFRTGALCWFHELTGKKIIVAKYFKFRFEKHKYDDYRNRDFELVIEAEKEEKAQQAYELFIASLTLNDAHTTYPIDDLPSVLSYTLNELKQDFFKHQKNIRRFSQSGIYKAALIAARASFRKSHSISLYKYLFGCSQHSNFIIHLDPFETDYVKLTRNPLDHLRYSYAILAFYSIIEELGLEIRASQTNPSKIKGTWNLAVKHELELRLKKAKVDISKKAVWNLRSRPTKVHKKDKLQLVGKAAWSRYSIRDSMIEVVDAISYTSWIRSKIIAHKLNNSFLSISIYDVANVNFLVRQILLDILESNNHGK